MKNFTLNAGQQYAVEGIVNCLKKNQDCMLVGRAGTGKTFTTNAILKHFPKALCAAPTHNAAGVFLTATGKDCVTLASLLKKKKVIDYTTGKVFFNPSRFIDGKRHIIIVDEASMVGKEDVGNLHKMYPNCTFLFIGDAGQLPPVKETKMVFDTNDLPKFELTENMRCGQGNSIFDLIEKVYMTDNITEESFESILESIDMSDGKIQKIKQEDLTKEDLVITYYNKSRVFFNKLINNDAPISSDTLLIANDNINYDGVTYDLKNGEYFKPKSVKDCKYRLEGDMVEYKMLELPNGRNVNYLQDRSQIQPYLDKCAKAGKWQDFYYIANMFPEIDLGYAVTSHKVQGCSLESVVVNVSDILNSPISKPSLYVALSRATTTLKLLH